MGRTYTRMEWHLLQSLRPGTKPKPKAAVAQPKKAADSSDRRDFLFICRGEIIATISAPTKSEARAQFKQRRGLRRVPISVTVK